MDFTANPKCIAFSALNVLAYMYLPCRYDPNWQYSVAGIAMASYVGMAWYDATYNCNRKLRPGFISPLSGHFKPTIRNGVYGG